MQLELDIITNVVIDVLQAASLKQPTVLAKVPLHNLIKKYNYETLSRHSQKALEELFESQDWPLVILKTLYDEEIFDYDGPCRSPAIFLNSVPNQELLQAVASNGIATP